MKLAEQRFCGQVIEDLLPSVDQAVQLYQQSGPCKRLTLEGNFGVDPLNEEQQEVRKALFFEKFPNVAIIFSSILKGDATYFRAALLYHVSVTEELATQSV